MSVAGLRFADAWRHRVRTDFDGVPAYVISRNDFIANKRAAGRPQDLVDVGNLEESKRIKGRSPRGSAAGERRPKRRRKR